MNEKFTWKHVAAIGIGCATLFGVYLTSCKYQRPLPQFVDEGKFLPTK